MGLWLKKSDGTVVEINSEGIAEAPEDGKQYARKDAAWAEVEATDIDDAPEDGQQYGRQNAAWSVIELDNGEHVLTGDPENPPAELDAGQLLWDGVEGGSGSGGGGSFEGEHVLTGDPQNPPADWTVGQLLYDGDPSTGGGGGGIEEAPSDGKQYARQDEAWSEVVAVADGEPATMLLQYGVLTSTTNGAGAIQINFDKKYAAAPAITVILDTPEITEARLTAIYSPVSREIDGDRAQFICYKSDGLRLSDTSVTARWVAVGEAADAADNNVGGSVGSGGGGPHDHAEYALVEHDHDEFVHDHDYLPLSGGTLTGALTVDKNLTLASETSNPLMVVNRAGSRVGYFGVPGAQAGENGELHLRSDKELMLQGIDGVRTLQCGLTVDTDLKVDGGTEMRSNARSVRVFTGGSGNVAQIGFTSAGSDTPAYGKLSGYEVWIDTGTTHDGLATELKVGRGTSTFFGNLRVNGTITGTLAFNIADGIDTRDVLERAETATMPALDDEGVTTTDAEGVTVNEVVTALLAKVKELSAEIEELRGA